jgi:hypothetical protein
MTASTLPSGPELLAIIAVATLITGGITLWHRFGPKNRALHDLLSRLNPELARLIAADYVEQVLGAVTDDGSMRLAHLGIATARAFALGKATSDELHAVRWVLSRAAGADLATSASKLGMIAVVSEAKPDLSSLASRLGSFGLPDFAVNTAMTYADERLQVSLPPGLASMFVMKAVACACSDEPNPFHAAQYARGAWQNQQTAQAMPGVSLTTALPVANMVWSMRTGRSTIAGARAGAGLIDSQIDLARDYAYNGPKIIASLLQRVERGECQSSEIVP